MLLFFLVIGPKPKTVGPVRHGCHRGKFVRRLPRKEFLPRLLPSCLQEGFSFIKLLSAGEIPTQFYKEVKKWQRLN